MIEHPLASIDAWTRFFEASTFPILARSKAELVKLVEKGEDATVLDLAAVAHHDALLALKILRYLQRHRSAQQLTDVTTVERVILMVGVDPLLRAFVECDTVEHMLQGHPQGLKQVLRVLQRAFHAAISAELWAGHRHDIDGGEVGTAALLRDIAEVLVGCFSPKLLLRIRAMQQLDKRLRSQVAQKTVLGFPLLELQLALIEAWHLPPILKMLMDEGHAENPRVRTVTTAVAYARHSANGWNDEALPDDYQAVADLAGMGYDKAQHLCHEASRKAQKSWDWFGDDPAEPPPPIQISAHPS
ncbi:hypothetical protein GCM10007907_29030 [Chitinimonas prasina]|uniref:HDOD domain-containing protein n=1 Tax=Chitinimonas prasina TaxID=1434937 RepID=A0ABQ5YI33_9NEIS|nr:HDOD domain-containing protein [Chitinimonas prasina]GLR14113.1 hypothetical protein GCM10007907_29030 [Chitinimonas prasina]